jgi:hypothetical protein
MLLDHTLSDLENRYLPEGSAYVETECIWGQLYMYINETHNEIQITNTMEEIGLSMIVQPTVLLPSSILPPLSSHWVFIN